MNIEDACSVHRGNFATRCSQCVVELAAENERLRAVLGTLCYEAHVLVKAHSTLSMAGLDVKPSFRRLHEAKIAGEKVLGDGEALPDKSNETEGGNG